jgi:ABC-type transport system substrate-binding protein
MHSRFKRSFSYIHPQTWDSCLLLLTCLVLYACTATSRVPETGSADIHPTLQPATSLPPTEPSPTAHPVSPLSTNLPASQPHPILGDERLRKGIAFCTDRMGLLEAAYPWLAGATNNEMDPFFPSSHWAYPVGEHGFLDYPFDPAAGADLLDQAGWELLPNAQFRRNAAGEALHLELTTTDSSLHKAWIKRFINQMQACGAEISPVYLPAEDFYAENGALQQRRFDMAAYSGIIDVSPDSGLPYLPLFNRVELSAARPELQNFSPDPGERYTWNAAQWSLPGKDSLTLGLSAEPASLFPMEDAYVSQLIQALVYGLDYTHLNYAYQPVTLPEFPSPENGQAAMQPVAINAGDVLVDIDNKAVPLQPGVHYRDALGNELVYISGLVETEQLTIDYQFCDNLVWSDGVPVTKADYQLAFRILCDPMSGAGEFLSPPAFCDKVESVAFTGDSSYIVTWKPGYTGPTAFLPPISRLPSHQVISDGRRLAEVPPAEWASLPEVIQAPLGIGPYRVKSWEYGKEIILEANPHYWREAPASPQIVVRFIPIDTGAGPAALISGGEIDIIGWDSLPNFPNSLEALLTGQADGKIALYPVASPFYERIDLNIDKEVQP